VEGGDNSQADDEGNDDDAGMGPMDAIPNWKEAQVGRDDENAKGDDDPKGKGGSGLAPAAGAFLGGDLMQ
jgi:hypothetical protein